MQRVRNALLRSSSTLATQHRPRLLGKVAVITGAASGIGESSARLFAENGAKVIVADVNEVQGRSLCEQLNDAHYVRCDVRNEGDVAAAVAAARSRYGQLDIMFNCAGVVDFGTCFHPIMKMEMSTFDHVHDINTRGTLLGIKHAAQAMIDTCGSTILNVASVGGMFARTGGGLHSYATTKAAVIHLTKTAAAELGKHGIRVNCISPAQIPTPLLTTFLKEYVPSTTDESAEKAVAGSTQIKGVSVTARDVANAALFLCSDEARYISGHNLVVDGGITAAIPFSLNMSQ